MGFHSIPKIWQILKHKPLISEECNDSHKKEYIAKCLLKIILTYKNLIGTHTHGLALCA